MTDPIADMLTRIRNAQRAGHFEIEMPSSKVKFALANILKKEGYVGDISQSKKGFRINLKIGLKKIEDRYAIQGIKRISKPGQRIYVNKDKIPYVLNNYGMAIISTSSGLMTNDEARKNKLGGEVICEVW